MGGLRPIVLLRGLSRESRHWQPAFVQALIAEGATSRVVTLDLPGTGARSAAVAPTTVAATASDVQARCQLPEPVLVVGLSMGAMVALQWARSAPETLAGVVLINGSVGRLSPPWRRVRPAGLAALLGAAWQGDALARESRILALTSTTGAQGSDAASLIAQSVELAREASPRWRRLAARQLLAAALYRPRLAPLDVPLLVIASQADALVDPSCSRSLAVALGAPLRVHPTAGHDLPLDDPGWVAREIARWISETKLSRDR